MILDKIIHHFYRFMILKKWLFINSQKSFIGWSYNDYMPIWIYNLDNKLYMSLRYQTYIHLFNKLYYIFIFNETWPCKDDNEFWHNKIHHHRQVRIYIAYMCNLIAKVPLNYGGVAFCLGSVIWDYTIWLLFIPML